MFTTPHPTQVFVSYPYITGMPLEPNVTFAALALMNLLNEPMYFVPMVTSLLVNAFVGMNRLQAFFLSPETERSHEIKWTDYLVDTKVTHDCRYKTSDKKNKTFSFQKNF